MFVTVPGGIAVDLLIVAAMTYDVRTRGRVHPAYLAGLPFLVVTQLAVVPVAASATWLHIAGSIEHLMG